jgi:hypothetical protein
MAVFSLAVPAVLAVHVEDEVGRHPALDHAAQQQARQKALAGAGLPEDAVAAFDEAAQVQSDRDVHIQGRAQLEAILAWRAKYPLEVCFVGDEHGGKVGRYRLDGSRTLGLSFLRRRTAGEH